MTSETSSESAKVDAPPSADPATETQPAKKGFLRPRVVLIALLISAFVLGFVAASISMDLESARTREGKLFMNRIEDDANAFMQQHSVFEENAFRGYSGYRQSLEFYDIDTLVFNISDNGPLDGDTITISPKDQSDAKDITSTYNASDFEWVQTTE